MRTCWMVYFGNRIWFAAFKPLNENKINSFGKFTKAFYTGNHKWRIHVMFISCLVLSSFFGFPSEKANEKYEERKTPLFRLRVLPSYYLLAVIHICVNAHCSRWIISVWISNWWAVYNCIFKQSIDSEYRYKFVKSFHFEFQGKNIFLVWN